MTYRVIESKALKVYQCLTERMHFSQEEKIAFYNERKGYQGEKKLESLIERQLTNNYIALYGLLLENQGSVFQLDCVLIFQRQIIMIEVKNFKDEFEIREDRLYSITHNKYYHHPLHQLQRSDTNLRELLSKLKINLPLQSYVSFVHQEFTLFAEKNPTIILPTQMKAFINKLNQLPGKVNTNHQKLAEKMESLHLVDSPYTRLPVYSFEALQKGVFCRDCRSRMQRIKNKLSCQHCTYKESMDSAILRSVIEFNILFPDKRITTRAISEWSSLNISDKSIRRILSTYLQHHSRNSGSYYLIK